MYIFIGIIIHITRPFIQIFIEKELAARDNTVLGEEGTKKAAMKKKKEMMMASDSSTPSPVTDPS